MNKNKIWRFDVTVSFFCLLLLACASSPVLARSWISPVFQHPVPAVTCRSCSPMDCGCYGLHCHCSWRSNTGKTEFICSKEFWEREWERETHTHIRIDRDREREIERQTDRQRQTHTHLQTVILTWLPCNFSLYFLCFPGQPRTANCCTPTWRKYGETTQRICTLGCCGSQRNLTWPSLSYLRKLTLSLVFCQLQSLR